MHWSRCTEAVSSATWRQASAVPLSAVRAPTTPATRAATSSSLPLSSCARAAGRARPWGASGGARKRAASTACVWRKDLACGLLSALPEMRPKTTLARRSSALSRTRGFAWSMLTSAACSRTGTCGRQAGWLRRTSSARRIHEKSPLVTSRVSPVAGKSFSKVHDISSSTASGCSSTAGASGTARIAAVMISKTTFGFDSERYEQIVKHTRSSFRFCRRVTMATRNSMTMPMWSSSRPMELQRVCTRSLRSSPMCAVRTTRWRRVCDTTSSSRS
mmetsp:Transcript_6497/g.26780  ORF Transcript_6497/g.26780 Transcript_6497/m.26780 type:complete len:274 (-) Transcript_6497:1228-2049(-)